MAQAASTRRSRPTFSGSGMENAMPRSLSDVTSSGSVPNRLRTHSCRSVRTDGTTLEMMTPRKSDGERFLSSKSCSIADSYWLADQVWLMSIRAVNSREYACCGAIRTPPSVTVVFPISMAKIIKIPRDYFKSRALLSFYYKAFLHQWQTGLVVICFSVCYT